MKEHTLFLSKLLLFIRFPFLHFFVALQEEEGVEIEGEEEVEEEEKEGGEEEEDDEEEEEEE